MAREGERDFVSGDTLTVVGDAQKALSPFANFDTNFGGAGVQAIFQQFLDHIGGTLDNFSSSNFGRHIGRKQLNRHKPIIPEKGKKIERMWHSKSRHIRLNPMQFYAP